MGLFSAAAIAASMAAAPAVTATAAGGKGGYEWQFDKKATQEDRDFVKEFYPDGPPSSEGNTKGAIGKACTGKLIKGTPLPYGVNPDKRKGTLFTYWNESTDTSCALFDNNTSGAKYMQLKLCGMGPRPTNPTPKQVCLTDKGVFSDYAGQVKLYATDYASRCDYVKAYMEDSNNKPIINVETNIDNCH